MTESTQACSERSYQITEPDLPLSCPLPSMAVWNAHPRVYLDIESHGEVICPYCGTHYTLQRPAS
ncbi:MAG: zinc-finger domain-containing protein [Methylophaga sp.]|nr:zinc-finger domain-containing protein [Methylophaga sp.]